LPKIHIQEHVYPQLVIFRNILNYVINDRRLQLKTASQAPIFLSASSPFSDGLDQTRLKAFPIRFQPGKR